MFRKFKPFEASAVFQFKDPDTGHIYKASSLAELYKAIVSYRAQNTLPALEMLREVVENYLCGLPENANKCVSVEMSRSVWKTIQGGIVLFKNLFFRKQVDQAVAEKRAAQCETCKFNVFPDRTNFTKWADDIAIMQVGERKVSNADKLGHCSICQCNLRAKVFFDGKLPKFPEEELVNLRSVRCWQIPLTGEK